VKIGGLYTVPAPRERTWTLLQDPAVLARCMPGCDGLERLGPDEYKMKMKMNLASFAGLFQGKVQITDSVPPDSFRLLVEGAGKIGFMKGDGALTLTANGDATDVQFDGDVQIGGTIAAVGQRLIDTTAKMLIKRFFERLNAEARPADV
jgi:carbon monoxide dehydrogenase subunit G